MAQSDPINLTASKGHSVTLNGNYGEKPANKDAITNEIRRVAKKATGIDFNIIITDDEKIVAAVDTKMRTIFVSTKTIFKPRLKAVVLHECGHYLYSTLSKEELISLIQKNWPSRTGTTAEDSRELIKSLLEREDFHYFLNTLEDIIVNNNLGKSYPRFKSEAYGDGKIFRYANPSFPIVSRTAYYIFETWLYNKIFIPMSSDEDVEIAKLLTKHTEEIFQACLSCDRDIVYGKLIPILAKTYAIADNKSQVASNK